MNVGAFNQAARKILNIFNSIQYFHYDFMQRFVPKECFDPDRECLFSEAHL